VHQTSKANIPVYDAPNPISPPNPEFSFGYLYSPLFYLFAVVVFFPHVWIMAFGYVQTGIVA